MKTFQTMAIGGFLVAVGLVVLQSAPDFQWVIIVGAGVFGLVALATLAIDAIWPGKAHSAPQPVAQPVPQPIDMVLQPAQPVAESWLQPAQLVQAVADRRSQPLAQPVAVDLQPPATGAQPDRNCGVDIMASMIVDEIPPMRPVPWLDQKVAPLAVDDDPVDLPGIPEPALPLPRRAPTAAEYPLVWQAIQGASSMNAAILAVYGSKDGRTHRWVSRVASFYRSIDSGPMPLGTQFVVSVFHHELIGTCDMPGMVAARLGLEVDDDQLDCLMAGLAQCEDCSAWYDVSDDCACQQQEEVE